MFLLHDELKFFNINLRRDKQPWGNFLECTGQVQELQIFLQFLIWILAILLPKATKIPGSLSHSDLLTLKL